MISFPLLHYVVKEILINSLAEIYVEIHDAFLGNLHMCREIAFKNNDIFDEMIQYMHINTDLWSSRGP